MVILCNFQKILNQSQILNFFFIPLLIPQKFLIILVLLFMTLEAKWFQSGSKKGTTPFINTS
jgi:hypothetical protein